MKKKEVDHNKPSRTNEEKSEIPTIKQPSCVICGLPATTAGYCDDHL